MFDIGFLEVLVIGVVALIVIGPERLPRVARTAGMWVGRARRAFANVKEEIDRELRAEELKEILRKQAESKPLERILDVPQKKPRQTPTSAESSERGADEGSSAAPTEPSDQRR